MRKLLIIALLSVCSSAFAQKNVYFRISHRLGTEAFSNSPATNSLGEKFNLERLEFYVSHIKITYDGGKDTLLADKYILVDAHTTTHELLGSFNFTDIEAVTFSIGVNQEVNHSDPSLYPEEHPLGQRSPSMHWGWAAGYRFVAMEGNAGDKLDQVFQIHALGDANYFALTLQNPDTMVNSDLVINIKADYIQALKGISVRSGPVVHGETDEAKKLLLNFNTQVFSVAEQIFSGIEGNGHKVNALSIFPNPCYGSATLLLDKEMKGATSVRVSTITGQQIKQLNCGADMNQVDLEIPQSGLYLIEVFNKGAKISTNKLIVY